MLSINCYLKVSIWYLEIGVIQDFAEASEINSLLDSTRLESNMRAKEWPWVWKIVSTL